MSIKEMKSVGIRTLDRSGSNLFLFLFHTHPEFFSVYEKKDLKDFELNEIPWALSMFRGQDKIKTIDETQIKYIVVKNSRRTFENKNSLEFEYYNYKYDKKIYLIRNPFRVYLSYLKRWGPRAELWFESIIRITKNNIEAYKEDLENNLDVRFVSYEYFLNNLNEEYNKIIKWIGATIEPNIENHRNRFKHFTGQGGFQTKEEISYERSVGQDIKILKDKVPIVRSILGDELTDYWFNDREHNYKRLLKI